MGLSRTLHLFRRYHAFLYVVNVMLIMGNYAPLIISVLSLGMLVQQVTGPEVGRPACVPIVAHVRADRYLCSDMCAQDGIVCALSTYTLISE